MHEQLWYLGLGFLGHNFEVYLWMHKFISECPCDQYLGEGGGSLPGQREELSCEGGNRGFSLSHRES